MDLDQENKVTRELLESIEDEYHGYAKTIKQEEYELTRLRERYYMNRLLDVILFVMVMMMVAYALFLQRHLLLQKWKSFLE